MKGFFKKVFLKKKLTLNFFVDLLPWVFYLIGGKYCLLRQATMASAATLEVPCHKRCSSWTTFFVWNKKTATHQRKNTLGSCSSSIFLKIFVWKMFFVKIENVFQVFPSKKKNCWIPTKFFGIFVSWMASSSPSMEIVVWTPAGLRFNVLINIQ